MRDELLNEIALLPSEWVFCACNGSKAPLGNDWQNNGLSIGDFEVAAKVGKFEHLQLKKKSTGEMFNVPSEWARSVGCIAGPISGGILFFDHDGKSCDNWVKEATGLDLSEALPKSPVVTSGRPGRYQIAYRVPEAFWMGIETRKYRTGVTGDDGKPEMVEFRWVGCQSIVAGEHPVTGGYHWKYHPSDVAIADAPQWMIEKMLIDVSTPERIERKTVSNLAVPLLSCCAQKTRAAIDGNYSEGRNDTAAKILAPDLIGTANYLNSISQPFEGNPEAIFFDWCSQVGLDSDKPKNQPETIWRNTEKKNPGPSLNPEQIEGCIRGWERRQQKTQPTKSPQLLPENEDELTTAEKLRLAVGYYNNEPDPFVRALLENQIRSDFSVQGRRLENLAHSLGKDQPEGFTDLEDLCVDLMAQIEARAASPTVPGMKTGLSSLDGLLGPMEEGELLILAARPSMGKTALAINILIHVAKTYGQTAFFSLEMSKHSLNYRMLSMMTGISSQQLKNGQLHEHQWPLVSQGVGELTGLPIAIDDTGLINLAEMREQLSELKESRGELKFVCIDYLQLMEASGGENRNMEISKITRGLKLLAKEFECSVLCLSQLSRAVEGRADKRPMMSDLRESGSIEQDADKIIMIYRDEYYHPTTEHPGTAELIVVKNRNGPVGTAHVDFDATKQRFESVSEVEF